VKLGDLNLLDEIDKQNVVEWHPVHRKKTGVVVRYLKVVVGTRRIYRAQIFGSQDPMTAVIYNDTQFEQVSHHVGNGYGLITASIHTVPVPLSELPEVKLTEYDLGEKLSSILELDEFYSIVACYPRGFPEFSRRTPKTIMLPSIYNPHWDRDSKPNDLHAIPTEKHLTLDDLYIGSWYDMYKSDLPQEVLPTGWTRCACGCFAPSFSNNWSIDLIIQSLTHASSGPP
jgi:hypothetical protein